MVATLGDDIKAVMVEVGVAYTIEKRLTTITGEYLDYDENTQTTKPFTFQNFLHANLAYDSQVEPGDVLFFNVDRRRYLAMAVIPELFENEILQLSATLYKTNSIISLLRLSGETVQYHTVNRWTPVNTDFPALLIDKQYATTLDETSLAYVDIDKAGLVLYTPSYITPIPDDRVLVSGESPYRGALAGALYYKVTSVENHSFDGVNIAYLEEDTRK